MAGQQWSESLCKLAVWLDALLTFEQTESVLAQVGQLHMSDSTAWRQLQKRGAQAQALEAARRLAATAAPDRQQIVPGEVTTPERLAATLDGGTPHLPVGAGVIHIRGEGWKELKVGGIGQIELAPGRDPLTGDGLDLAHTVENT